MNRLVRFCLTASFSLFAAVSIADDTAGQSGHQEFAKKASSRKMRRMNRPESSLPKQEEAAAGTVDSTRAQEDLSDPDGSLRDTRNLGDGPSGF